MAGGLNAPRSDHKRRYALRSLDSRRLPRPTEAAPAAIRAALPQVARGRVAGARAPIVQARSAIQTSSNHCFFSPLNLLSRPCAYARHRGRVDALHNPGTQAKFRRPSRTPSWGWTLDGGSRSLAAGRNDAANGRNAGSCGRSLAAHQLAVPASRQSGLSPDRSRPDNNSPTYCQQSIALL